MKLSEVLKKDWPEKKTLEEVMKQITHADTELAKDQARCMAIGHNTALTSCDREIDREALAKALYAEVWDLSWEKAGDAIHSLYIEKADKFISTMPTWLKRIEK